MGREYPSKFCTWQFFCKLLMHMPIIQPLKPNSVWRLCMTLSRLLHDLRSFQGIVQSSEKKLDLHRPLPVININSKHHLRTYG